MSITLIGHDQPAAVWDVGVDDTVCTLTIPGAVVSGCLLVVYGTASRAMSVPSGWTGLGTAFSGKYLGIWRVADGSEGSTVSVTLPGPGFGEEVWDPSQPVLLAFGKRTFSGSPAATWSELTATPIFTPTRYNKYTIGSEASASDDSVYLAWLDVYGGPIQNLGFDVCDESITWDAQLTEVDRACAYEEHAYSTVDSSPVSFSTMWAVASLPIPAGTNPATETHITVGASGNRYMHRSNVLGVSIPTALSGYWGILVAPV